MKKINVKGAVVKVAATGGGAIAAASLNKVAAIQKMKPAVRGLIKIGLGAFLPGILGKGKKAQMFEDAGAGAIAVGSLELANSTVFKNAPLGIAGVGPYGANTPVYVPPYVQQGTTPAAEGTTLNY